MSFLSKKMKTLLDKNEKARKAVVRSVPPPQTPQDSNPRASPKRGLLLIIVFVFLAKEITYYLDIRKVFFELDGFLIYLINTGLNSIGHSLNDLFGEQRSDELGLLLNIGD